MPYRPNYVFFCCWNRSPKVAKTLMTIIPLCTKTAKDPWHLKSNIRHNAIFPISISTPAEIQNPSESCQLLPTFFRLPNKRPTPISTSIHDAARLKLVEFALEFVRTGELTGEQKWFHSSEVCKKYETMICFFWMFNTKERVPNYSRAFKEEPAFGLLSSWGISTLLKPCALIKKHTRSEWSIIPVADFYQGVHATVSTDITRSCAMSSTGP